MNTQNAPQAPLMVPPHDISAEQAVLGAVMLDGSVFDEVRQVIAECDFYRNDHRQIWRAYCEVADNNQPIDLMTVNASLKDTFDGVDNVLAYLGEIAKNTPSAANVKGYAKIAREYSVLRQWLGLAADISAKAYSHDGSLSDRVKSLMELATKRIYDLEFKQDSDRTKMTSMTEVLKEELAYVDRLSKMKEGEFIGLKTGSVDLDAYFNGIKPGFYIVGARPSMGKTAFLLGLGLAAAESPESDDYGDLTVLFSLETDMRSLIEKKISVRGSVDYKRIQTPQIMNDDDWNGFSTGVHRISQLKNFHFNDTTEMKVDEIKLACRKLMRKTGKKMRWIGVDYIQIMRASANYGGNRTQEIGEISRELKAIVKEFNCPVVALSQLNRGVESRPNKRPLMSDLRESGDVEQDADAIMLLFRDEYYTRDACEVPGQAEILITKNKKGKTGTVLMKWEGQYQRFSDYIPDVYAPDYGGSVSGGGNGAGRRMTAGMRERKAKAGVNNG